MERLSARLLSWASLIDEKTLAQAHTTARIPFIHPHLALMPDAHLVVIYTMSKPRAA